MKNPYAIAVGGLVVAGVVLVVIFGLLPQPARQDLLVEIAAAAIAFFPVAFFSVIVADVVRRRDADKARREQDIERRRAFRLRVVTAYNDSKAARSDLRAAGLRPDSDLVLTDALLSALDVEMHSLVRVQLTMELLKREAELARESLADLGRVSEPLGTIEKYLKRVIKDWEAGRPGLRPGAPASDLAAWMHYRDFVAEKDAERLPDSPTAAFKALEEAMVRELDGVAI